MAGASAISSSLGELEGVGASGELQDVERVVLVGVGDRDDLVGDFADGEDDVGAGDIVVHDDDQSGALNSKAGVCLRVVQFAHNDPHAHLVQAQRLLKVGNQNDVRDVVLVEFLHQVGRHRIEMGQDDVVGHRLRNRTRGPRPVLLLQPGGVKKLDEGEREHDQQKHDPGQQNNDGIHPAEIAHECDVAEAQGRHDRQRPVKPRQPGVVLPLVGHQEMKQNAVDEEKKEENHQKAHQQPGVALLVGAVHQRRHLGKHELHAHARNVGGPRRRPVGIIHRLTSLSTYHYFSGNAKSHVRQRGRERMDAGEVFIPGSPGQSG